MIYALASLKRLVRAKAAMFFATPILGMVAAGWFGLKVRP
jgi:hypothetical protein